MKRVVWDEGNLEYNELTKSSTQKINEPKTPYHAPLTDGEMSPCPNNGETSHEGAVNAEAVRDALSDIAARPSTSDASSSRSGRGGWTSSEDERTEDEGDEMDHDSKDGTGRRRSFEEHRRKHYDEFRKVKMLRAAGRRIEDENEDLGIEEAFQSENGDSHLDAVERETLEDQSNDPDRDIYDPSAAPL
eukprot:TRINITY_DN1603_c0_g1_i2.p1 TRINITY_DN1603_c0_g1~~TRINITY_DN1603_c0_g1_i2.p1  ORF type:complete len:189 (-),score=39.05 TRINITY_DN1603_c0_g1_i2:175-741(-)